MKTINDSRRKYTPQSEIPKIGNAVLLLIAGFDVQNINM